MKLFLTKRPNGTFLISKFKPTICRVYGTKKQDVYMQPGEPAGIFACDLILKIVGSEDIEVFESIEVELTGKVIKKLKKLPGAF